MVKTPESSSDFVALFTYWNSRDPNTGIISGAPVTQSVYIDDVVITTELPDTTDSFGNAFIGTGNLVLKPRPNPPIIALN